MLKTIAAFLTGTCLIHGWQGNQSFNMESVYFPLVLTQGTERVVTTAMLDTGSYMLVVPEKIADELKLKSDTTEISKGIGGFESDKESKVDLELGNHIYKNIPCEISQNTQVVWFSMGTLRYLGATKLEVNLTSDEIKITGV